jgi:hypothetical protein
MRSFSICRPAQPGASCAQYSGVEQGAGAAAECAGPTLAGRCAEIWTEDTAVGTPCGTGAQDLRLGQLSVWC